MMHLICGNNSNFVTEHNKLPKITHLQLIIELLQYIDSIFIPTTFSKCTEHRIHFEKRF